MDELKNVVGKAAPILGSVLNSFLPGSGLIISGLSALFGADPNNSDDLLNKIKLDPESIVKLKQFELEHAYDLAKIINADRESARNRQVEYAKSLGRDWVMDFLAVFVSVAFVSLCFIVAYSGIKPDEKDLFYMLLGTFSTVWGGIVAFYFGGSPATMYKQKNDFVLPPPEQTRK